MRSIALLALCAASLVGARETGCGRLPPTYSLDADLVRAHPDDALFALAQSYPQHACVDGAARPGLKGSGLAGTLAAPLLRDDAFSVACVSDLASVLAAAAASRAGEPQPLRDGSNETSTPVVESACGAYGCCPDSTIAKRDADGSNCASDSLEWWITLIIVLSVLLVFVLLAILAVWLLRRRGRRPRLPVAAVRFPSIRPSSTTGDLVASRLRPSSAAKPAAKPAAKSAVKPATKPTATAKQPASKPSTSAQPGSSIHSAHASKPSASQGSTGATARLTAKLSAATKPIAKPVASSSSRPSRESIRSASPRASRDASPRGGGLVRRETSHATHRAPVPVNGFRTQQRA